MLPSPVAGCQNTFDPASWRPGSSATCGCCTTRRRNAHDTDIREFLYLWHPWSGHHVHIHEVIGRASGEVLRCSSAGSTSERWLEIPVWMFDRVTCSTLHICVAPYVNIAALSALARLLHVALPISALPISGAASGSHDSHRGDIHAAPAQDLSVRSVLQPPRPRNGIDAAVADIACGDAPDIDDLDGAPAS
jgi:hypothetical protein